MSTKHLLHLARKLRKQRTTSRTFSLEYANKKFWVKNAAPGEANIWHHILALLARVFRNKLFIPTVVRDPYRSLAHEANKLQHLQSLGIAVPKVVLQEKDVLILEDTGTPLSELLTSPATRAEKKRILVQHTASKLASLHNVGQYHSRPALRDMTYKDGRIYFLDFEEDLQGILQTDEAILRDGLIFMSCLFRRLDDEELLQLGIETYRQSVEPEYWQALCDEAKQYRLTYSLTRLLKPVLGKDGLALHRMLAYFRNREPS